MTSSIPYTAVNCISISLYFIAYSMTLYLIVRTHPPALAKGQKGEMGPGGQNSTYKSRETKSDVLDSLFNDEEDEDEDGDNPNRGKYTGGFSMQPPPENIHSMKINESLIEKTPPESHKSSGFILSKNRKVDSLL
jgi:hypothetical protein